MNSSNHSKKKLHGHERKDDEEHEIKQRIMQKPIEGRKISNDEKKEESFLPGLINDKMQPINFKTPELGSVPDIDVQELKQPFQQ